jgi:hypothetical protein
MYIIFSDFESNYDRSDFISLLPEEISVDIFMFLKGDDLLSCRLVCKSWMSICEMSSIQERIDNFKKEQFEAYWNQPENKTTLAVTPLANSIERIAFNQDVVQKLFNTSPMNGRQFSSPSPVPIGRLYGRSPSSPRQRSYLSPNSSEGMNSSPRTLKSPPVINIVNCSPLVSREESSTTGMYSLPSSSPFLRDSSGDNVTSSGHVMKLLAFNSSPLSENNLGNGMETLFPSESPGKMTQRSYISTKKTSRKKKSTPNRNLLHRL